MGYTYSRIASNVKKELSNAGIKASCVRQGVGVKISVNRKYANELLKYLNESGYVDRSGNKLTQNSFQVDYLTYILPKVMHSKPNQ